MTPVIGAFISSLFPGLSPPSRQHFLANCIRTDHCVLPLFSRLSMSLIPLNEREALVRLRLAGSRARGGKMRRKRDEERGGQEKRAWSDCKWGVGGDGCVLERWLVSVGLCLCISWYSKVQQLKTRSKRSHHVMISAFLSRSLVCLGFAHQLLSSSFVKTTFQFFSCLVLDLPKFI